MPMWRCPHCGTPQAETARCWVCRRSSTTCSTCRHFRRSIAAQVGYCGLDRRRRPLLGTELRGCWEVEPARNAGAVPAASAALNADEAVEPPSPALRLRDFVPVELAHRNAAAPARARTTGAPAPGVPIEPRPDVSPAWAERVTLFADAEL
ncbi:MAG: hypothetical protein C0498_12720 [Anaerolinea sp.]|nr:hypothetical protein [Anaerolinea sp.]